MRTPTFDVVVFGATSFVGQILCRTLVARTATSTSEAEAPIRWAMAGRSRNKLEELRTSLGAAAADIAIIVADAADDDALGALCAQTRVVVSTVGPYALYGEPLVRACARSGVDYCDLTGEAPWIKRMIASYGADAARTGARIVHCCGFDSIPSDLGVFVVQQHAQQRAGVLCTDIKMRVMQLRGGVSGGTVASMMNLMREASRDAALRSDLQDPYLLCPPVDGVARTRPRQTNIMVPRHERDVQGFVAPYIMAGINVPVVLRSHALAHAGDAPLRYDEAMRMGAGVVGLCKALALTSALGAIVVAAVVPPVRFLLERFVLPRPGEGPSEKAQLRGSFLYRFIGRTANGQEIHVDVGADRDPGYGATARMLAEAALCLAQDITKAQVPGGSYTPSTAMGAQLLARLQQHAGMTFTVTN